jgi:hypothetical protein
MISVVSYGCICYIICIQQGRPGKHVILGGDPNFVLKLGGLLKYYELDLFEGGVMKNNLPFPSHSDIQNKCSLISCSVYDNFDLTLC